MYLDGYTPVQILVALRKTMLKAYYERVEKEKAIQEQKKLETAIANGVEKALSDLFKGFI